MRFVLVPVGTPPESGTELIDLVANLERKPKVAHVEGRDSLGNDFYQNLFTTLREKVLFPTSHNLSDPVHDLVEDSTHVLTPLGRHTKVLT